MKSVLFSAFICITTLLSAQNQTDFQKKDSLGLRLPGTYTEFKDYSQDTVKWTIPRGIWYRFSFLDLGIGNPVSLTGLDFSVGFKKYKGLGIGTKLITECIDLKYEIAISSWLPIFVYYPIYQTVKSSGSELLRSKMGDNIRHSLMLYTGGSLWSSAGEFSAVAAHYARKFYQLGANFLFFNINDPGFSLSLDAGLIVYQNEQREMKPLFNISLVMSSMTFYKKKE